MDYANINQLTDEHFDLLQRLYNKNKYEILELSESELGEMLFPNGDSPLWDAMVEFDENNEPMADTLLAEQICDILRPADIYHP